MNRTGLEYRRRQVTNLVRMGNRKPNGLYWSATETTAHATMKFLICDYLRKQGEWFFTEAIFSDGSGRADIIAVDRAQIIEVVESESQLSIDLKKLKYPLPIITVPASAEWNEKLIL